MTKFLDVDLSPRIPGPEATPAQADVDRLFEFVDFGLNEGKLHQAFWGRVRVTVRDDRESPPGLTDLMNTVPFRIVSRRFVELLKSHQCACEYLPLEVTYKRKMPSGEFFAINVLNIADSAVDLERSVFDPRLLELGFLRDVKKLVLKDDALAGEPIVYFKQIGRMAVSDELARDIAATMFGVQLVEPESFTS